MTPMGYHTLLALMACNSEKFAIQWFRMHHINFFKFILLSKLATFRVTIFDFFHPGPQPIHMETHYNKLAKICTNCFCLMTKKAAMPIYGKSLLKIFSSPRMLMTLGIGI